MKLGDMKKDVYNSFKGTDGLVSRKSIVSIANNSAEQGDKDGSV